MKMFSFPKVIPALLLSALAVIVTPTVNAQLVCNAWQSGGSTSQSIYNCNFSDGSRGGSYGTSYDCYNNNFKDDCTISYTGGSSYQGDCTIVFLCDNGSSYYCDVDNWNGKESIQCDYVPKNCYEIYVCKPPTPTPAPVPEPSTVLAGSLLLIPLGISTVRIFRKNKADCSI